MNAAGSTLPHPFRTLLLALLSVAAVTGIFGCAHQSAIGAAPAAYLWQSGDQYVALVPAEQEPNGVPNDHPVSLDRERLGAVLATLGWQESADAKPIALLTDYQVSVLAEQVGSGLARAAAGDDLVFALVGNHPAFMGLAKRPQVTTGRIFYSRGRLHMILGQVHEELGRVDDRRLHPFVPGSRVRGAELAGTVIVTPGVGEKRRGDWLVIDPAAVPPKAQPGIGLAPAPPLDAVPLASPEPAKPKPQAPGADAAKRIEERLLLLNGLKEKGLVTDEEYRAKRREILDSF